MQVPLPGLKERVMTIVAGAAEQAPSRGHLAPMALAALGVVYGDIGTSPLYTFKTAIAWAGGRSNTGGGARHAVTDRVDARHHHLDQIRRDCNARRQRWRGRHPGADVVARHQAWRTRRRDRPWNSRRRLALRRRRHHPGDIGAERARGHQDAVAGIRALRVAAVDLRSHRAVLPATPGYCAHRPAVRPDHDALVRDNRSARA